MLKVEAVAVFVDKEMNGGVSSGDPSIFVGKLAPVLPQGRGVCFVSSIEDADLAMFLKEGGRLILVWRFDGETTEIFTPVSPSVIGLGRQNGFWDLFLTSPSSG